MEGYQILLQISLYLFCFAIGAMIEHFNLRHNQIIYQIFKKMVVKMKKLDHLFGLSVIVIILVLIFLFFRDSITTYNAYFNFGLTLLLVATNYLMVSETNKMRKAQTQPNVYVAIQPVDELNTELFIHNIGLGSAYNIEFIDPPLFQYSNDKFLSEEYLIKYGIGFLAPNQKMQIFTMKYDQVTSLNSEDLIQNIEIKYSDEDENIFPRAYKIDFNVNFKRMRGFTTFENLFLDNIVEIKKSISDISSNFEIITGVRKPDKFEIAKNMVKKVLIEFLNDWKSYSKSDEIWSNEDAEYIEFVAGNNRLDYHLFQFTLVSNEISADGALPDDVSNKLIEFAAKMRVIASQSDIVSSDAWSREYPSSIPNQFDDLLADIKKLYENLDEICGAA